MRFLWISGWAVPPAWLAEQAHAAFPEASHAAVSPSVASIALNQKKFDTLGGYSLGSLWLLTHANDVPDNLPTVLLAPFFSFPAEDGDGGRVTLAQLRLQRRRFRTNPKAAVTDFYRRSGLDGVVPVADNFSAEETSALDTELDWLEHWRCVNPPPKHWFGFVGEDDLLLDADKLQKKWPTLRRVPASGHAPGPLLQAAAREFQRGDRQ